MPTTGTDKILVLCIDFSDYPAATTTATIADKVFGAGDSTQYPYASLHNYYQRSSYNLLDLQGSVLGWYRPAYTRASMAMTGASRENLIKEALQYYDDSVDYSQLDNDHRADPRRQRRAVACLRRERVVHCGRRRRLRPRSPEYNLDNTGWITGTSLLYVALPDHSHDGTHNVAYRAVDNAGNLESAGSCSVMIDTAGPVTSDDSGGVWHRTPYTVTVMATDANSGVGAVYVGARGSEPKKRSTVTFRARRHNLGGGVFPISYFALDSIGNSGDSHVGYVRIDDEKPTTTINFTSGAVVYGSFTVVLTPHDKFSGVASPDGTHFRTRLNGGTWNSWTTGTSGTIPAPPTGEYAGDVEYYSVDRAGNVGLTQSASLTILPARLVAGLYYPPPAR
jgi:hypothetical protein